MSMVMGLKRLERQGVRFITGRDQKYVKKQKTSHTVVKTNPVSTTYELLHLTV